MRISCFTGGMVQTNGYLVEGAGGNFLVDAPRGIAGWVAEKGVRLDGLYLTHQHYDHVEDAAEIQGGGVKIFGWAEYSRSLTLEEFGAGWGLPKVAEFRVDELISEGVQELHGARARVGHIPGHSLDSVSLYFEEAGVVFAGDALFAGAVGRCDLPGGDFELLLAGIRRELLGLPGETRVFAGHGGATTVGREKMTNGYLR